MRSSGDSFTLIELVVVVGLIAAISYFVVGGFVGVGNSTALQSAQATVANSVTAARLRAVATGKRTRILLPVDYTDSGRFLRVLVLQAVRDPFASSVVWDTVMRFPLPDGVYVCPRDPSTFAGLLASGFDWSRRPISLEALGSSAFAGSPVTIDLQDGEPAVSCEGVSFTERGSLAKIDGSGWSLSSLPPVIVVVNGQRQSLSAGNLPVVLRNPDGARGVMVSVNGVPALIDQRSSF